MTPITMECIPSTLARTFSATESKLPASGTLNLTQPIYEGGKTRHSVKEAKNKIMAEKASLREKKQAILFDAITAYLQILKNRKILEMRKKSEGLDDLATLMIAGLLINRVVSFFDVIDIKKKKLAFGRLGCFARKSNGKHDSSGAAAMFKVRTIQICYRYVTAP